MIFTSPMPFELAVRRLESKTPIATLLTTEELQGIELGLLDRAFFSARVNDIRTVVEMQSRIDDALTLVRRDGGAFMDRSRFIADMRVILGAAPGDTGDLTDITSARRLGLIYDFNVEDAMEYGRWLTRQDPTLLAAFPCSELVRVEHREIPRGYRKGPGGRLVEVPDESWPARWEAAGGKFFNGRMIARKDDPIWIAISRFGRPWPPFDFNSGMGLADVGVDEAEQLGVMQPGEKSPAPQHLEFNHNLQAKLTDGTDPATLARFKKMFGDQVSVDRNSGNITWQGQRIAALYKAALTDPSNKWSIDLGESTPDAVAAAKGVGVDLTEAELAITADDIRHIDRTHGTGRELDPAQRDVDSLDAQLLVHVWRDPDAVELGEEPGTLVFRKQLIGETVLVIFDRQAKSGKWGVKTLYIKKGTP